MDAEKKAELENKIGKLVLTGLKIFRNIDKEEKDIKEKYDKMRETRNKVITQIENLLAEYNEDSTLIPYASKIFYDELVYKI